MPRAKSDQIVTHRIEMGKWEREQLTPVLRMGRIASSVGAVTAGAGMFLAAYGLWWFFDAGWGITKNIKEAADNYWEAVKAGNPLYLSPLEMPEREEDWEPAVGTPVWMKQKTANTPLDHNWWWRGVKRAFGVPITPADYTDDGS